MERVGFAQEDRHSQQSEGVESTEGHFGDAAQRVVAQDSGRHNISLPLQCQFTRAHHLRAEVGRYSQCGELAHVGEGRVGQSADLVVAQVSERQHGFWMSCVL